MGVFVAAMKGDRLYAPLLLSLMGLRPASLRAAVAGYRPGCGHAQHRQHADRDGQPHGGGEGHEEHGGRRRAAASGVRARGSEDVPRHAGSGRLAAGEGYEGAGYVLVDELGAALNGRQLRVRAYKIMDENGLRRVRLYDARASCLTYLANNGVPDHLLAMWAGHANVKTTKKWHVKPDVADLLPAAEAWGGLAGGV
ncbi:hypothetical protein OG399_37745 [Streptomyces achromogenes]